MRHAVGMILLSTVILSGATLPKKGPMPVAKPETLGGQPTPTPRPPSKPAKARDGDEGSANDASKAERLPGKGEDLPQKDDALPPPPGSAAPAEVIVPVKTESAEEYASCLAALRKIGSRFTEATRIDDGSGCGIDKPIEVETILPGVALTPGGKMRCRTALALATWTKDAAAPAARTAFGPDTRITALNQASTYVCRRRNGASTGKISEHAHGNAVDIASFELADGKTIDIQPRDEDGTLTGAFQRAVTASACLYFTTVLDPGSDEAHEMHLHLDVIERENGYRYCR